MEFRVKVGAGVEVSIGIRARVRNQGWRVLMGCTWRLQELVMVW